MKHTHALSVLASLFLLVCGAAGCQGGAQGAGGETTGDGFSDAKRTLPTQTQRAAALERGLKWLAQSQYADGSFGAAPSSNPTQKLGVNALASLAMLGEGSTLRVGPRRDALRKAIAWIRSQQQDNGMFGTPVTRVSAYNHALATLALVECYGLSGEQELRAPAQRAVDYICKARNPYRVWRYTPRDGANDSSVTTWMLLALCAARDFKLTIDPAALRFAAQWFDEVTDPITGEVGYSKRGERSSRDIENAKQFPVAKTEALTAAGLLCRFALGQKPATHPVMRTAADTLLRKPPMWKKDGRIDLYYWYCGTFSMFQMGGEHWKQWREYLEPALIGAQETQDAVAGSWSPDGAWGGQGGRVYTTALSLLSLEASYRYARLVR